MVLVVAACGPPLLAGSADLKLRDLVTSQAATEQQLAALLTDDAGVHRADATVKGRDRAARLLAQVKPGGETRLMRHHDVSLLVLGDGRVLFIARSPDDRVARAVELRAPEPGDGLPWEAVYYDKAWNADDPNARLALLKAMWGQGGRYVDQMADVTGPDGVSKMIGNFRLIFTGATVSPTSGAADAGGGWLTFDWVIKSRLGGRTLFSGFDVVHLNADGQVELLAGFFGTRR
jgi:hypothetical protein